MRDKVFISYSHKDAEWLNRLHVHLKPLMRDQNIDIWDDTRIAPGEKWHDEIQKALDSAKAAVLLVSPDFLASDFIAKQELPALLQAAEKDGAAIFPVIIRPSRFLKTPLAQFQAINPPEKPLSEFTKGKQDAVLVKLSEAIESALEKVTKDTPEPEKPPITKETAPAQTGSATKIWFSDFLHPDPVAVKLAVLAFENGERNFTIEWPEENRRLVETLADLLGQVKNYRHPSSAFYGSDPKELMEFIDRTKEYTTTEWYQEKTHWLEQRVPCLLQGMESFYLKGYYGVGTECEIALANYLIYANYDLHVYISFLLSFRALYEKYYPQKWDRIQKANTQKAYGILFNVDEPFYRGRLQKISGNYFPGVGRHIDVLGPKPMMVDACYYYNYNKFDYGGEFDGFYMGSKYFRGDYRHPYENKSPCFVMGELEYKYLIPQIEWKLAQKHSTAVIPYSGDVGIYLVHGRNDELDEEAEWWYLHDQKQYYQERLRKLNTDGFKHAEDDDVTDDEVQEFWSMQDDDE